MSRGWAWANGLLLVVLTFLGGACGSDVSGGPAACGEGLPCAAGEVCSAGVCVSADAVGGEDGIGATDTVAPGDAAAEVTPDTAAPADSGATDADEPRDVAPFDYRPVDLIQDHEPPRVVSISPAEGEDNVPLDFVVRVEFSEPVRVNSVEADGVVLLDVGGAPVPGVFSYEPDDTSATVVIFTPSEEADLQLGSPYTVEVSTSVRDNSVNRNQLERFYRATFFTETPGDLERYRALAETYAPRLYQATSGTATAKPQFDYLAGFDLDSDWDGTNNFAAINTATFVTGKVYYTVIETRSHYFINYLFFHPYRAETDAEKRLTNEMSGAQVVVSRFDEQPILVQVYSKRRELEDIYAYATDESGIAATVPRPNLLTGSYPAAELFPEGRFTGWLTSVFHAACLWLDRERSPQEPCYLNDAIAESLTRIEYAYQPGGADPIMKDDETGFPLNSAESVGYDLEDVIVKLWPRRLCVERPVDPTAEPGTEATCTVYEDSFVFDSNELEDGSYRPGRGVVLGQGFVNTVSQSSQVGLMGWAWSWAPTEGNFVPRAQGTFFLDPAYFLVSRFPALPDWDPAARTGVSLDYCFNPFLGIDERQTEEACAPPEPPETPER